MSDFMAMDPIETAWNPDQNIVVHDRSAPPALLSVLVPVPGSAHGLLWLSACPGVRGSKCGARGLPGHFLTSFDRYQAVAAGIARARQGLAQPLLS
jgi:hypothetical protein